MSLGSVTTDICNSSSDSCEAYIKKGTVNGTAIQSCSDYCAFFNLACKESYDDNNSCTRGERYPSCDEIGGATTDHICVCGNHTCQPW